MARRQHASTTSKLAPLVPISHLAEDPNSRPTTGALTVGMLETIRKQREQGTIYVLEALGVKRVKIGFCTGSLYSGGSRIRTIAMCCPVPLRLIAYLDGSWREERRIHKLLSAHRIGRSEWFEFTDEVREVLKRERFESESFDLEIGRPR